MSSDFTMTRGQAEAGVGLCLDKVSNALDGAEIMCRNGGHETVAVYLYTAAIEELGKALLICDVLGKAGKDDPVSVPRGWFVGGNAHGAKFARAHGALPEECIVYHHIDPVCDSEKMPMDHAGRLRDGIEVLKTIHKAEDEMYRKSGAAPPERRGGYVITRDHGGSGGTRGARATPSVLYDAGRVSIPVLFDFATRKNMLYADWDDKIKRWNSGAIVGPTKYVGSDDDIRFSVEVEKDESELYPAILLAAASSLRDALSGLGWPPGTISKKAQEIGRQRGRPRP